MMKRLVLMSLIALMAGSAGAQSRWYFGPAVGFTVSRTSTNDTFANNFSRRNKFGPRVGLMAKYSLGRVASLDFGLAFTSKGYKINNDSLGTSPSVSRSLYAMEIPLGLSFKQTINGESFITEKFGLIGTYSFANDSSVFKNNESNTNFTITERNLNRFYPMFYLGVKIGGVTGSKNRYEFGATYMQSLAKDSELSVNYGNAMKRIFPLNYGGGYLTIGFTYYFNSSNFKVEKSDYFID